MKVSTSEEDKIITYSLGSCVALSLYDPTLRAGGLIHCMLPLSKLDKAKAAAKPCMFTDTGIMTLLEAMYKLGATQKNLVAKVAGGAAPLESPKSFKIGDRNYAVLRKVLWKNNILVAAQDVGGTKARTMSLFMDTGKITIKSNGSEVEL